MREVLQVLLLLLAFDVTSSSSRRNVLNTAHPHAVQRAEVRPEDEHLSLKFPLTLLPE